VFEAAANRRVLYEFARGPGGEKLTRDVGAWFGDRAPPFGWEGNAKPFPLILFVSIGAPLAGDADANARDIFAGRNDTDVAPGSV